jgi:exopolysaccharide production protein ExoQ
VLLSTSKTALVATVLLLLLLRFYRVLRRSAGAATLVAIGVLLIGGIPAVWIASEADTMLAALGRDPTLTGRTVLWTFVAESIRQRPWLGYGFSAFWTSSNTASRAIIDELHWSTPHAHNGFLDLTLELGVIGLAVFLLGYVVAVLRAIRVVRSAEVVPALWPITYLTFLFLYNLTESASLKQGSIFWVLYVATLCSPMWAPSARGPSGGVTARGSELRGRLSIGVRQRMWPRLSAMRHRHSDRA